MEGVYVVRLGPVFEVYVVFVKKEAFVYVVCLGPVFEGLQQEVETKEDLEGVYVVFHLVDCNCDHW